MPTSYPTTATHGDFPAGRYPTTRAAESSRNVRGNELAADFAKPSATVAIPASGTHAAGRRVAKRELLAMTSQLAIMTRSGLDITSALQSLARQARRPAVKAMLEQVYADVLAGQSVSSAMKRYSRVFGESYVASIAAGEAAGRLPDVLKQLAELLRSEIRLRSTLRTVLSYPILLATVSSLVLAGLILFVLPQFANIFDEYDVPLPVLTQILLGISHELRVRFWLWGALAVGGVAGLIAFRFSGAGQRAWDGLLLNSVVVRDVTRALLIGRTCRMLGIMISSGVPLLETLRLARSSVQNSLYQDLLQRLEFDVTNGRGLGDGMLSASFVPSSAAEMVATAERTGTMGMVTELIGQHYEEEGEAKLRELVTILEPLIIVAMGIIVAVVVLSVMLPMFDLATLAQQQG